MSTATVIIQEDDGKRYAIECRNVDLVIEQATPRLDYDSPLTSWESPKRTASFTSTDFSMVMAPLTIEELAAVVHLTPDSVREYLDTKDPQVLVRA